MAIGMLINVNRCIGCWTCSMACKVGNELSDDDFRIDVRTIGSGKGIDRPVGVYPKLSMGWKPIYTKGCTYCAARVRDGHMPFCTFNCPTGALMLGDAEDAGSPLAAEIARLKEAGYRVFRAPIWENTKAGILYAEK